MEPGCSLRRLLMNAEEEFYKALELKTLDALTNGNQSGAGWATCRSTARRAARDKTPRHPEASVRRPGRRVEPGANAPGVTGALHQGLESAEKAHDVFPGAGLAHEPDSPDLTGDLP
mgnify:CR=1 FL=1